MMSNLYKDMTRKKENKRKKTAGKEDTSKNVAMKQMKILTRKL